MKVSVIGAAGHVGLPFSLVVADVGHEVVGIDINEQSVKSLNAGWVPFKENLAAELLEKCLSQGNLRFTTSRDSLADSDIVVIMVGTPVDSENNPRLDDILRIFTLLIVENRIKDRLFILRSTVSPGTTQLIKETIERKTGLTEGLNFGLVFVPERVAQGFGIVETGKFPNLVGAFCRESYRRAADFFGTFSDVSIRLTPREAEIGKLITNMYRYVNFALANELYMIGSYYNDVNVHKVVEACNFDYPRMNLPYPGPNVGGPCLFKDGKFLTENIPYSDLIQNAFLINEGMPAHIIQHLDRLDFFLSGKKAMILGMAFKADSDDTRNSLSFKMKKLLKARGVDVICLDEETDIELFYWPTLKDVGAIIVMTPHSHFEEFYRDILIKEGHKDTIFIDIWKKVGDSVNTLNGIYRLGDFQ